MKSHERKLECATKKAGGLAPHYRRVFHSVPLKASIVKRQSKGPTESWRLRTLQSRVISLMTTDEPP